MPQPKHKPLQSIRVVASPDGFFVKDSAGQNLNTAAVDIAVRPGKPPVVRLGLYCGNFDVAGVPVFSVADPATGRPKPVRKIIWFDGTSTDFPEPPLEAAQFAQGPVPPAPAVTQEAAAAALAPQPEATPGPVDGNAKTH